MFAYDFTPFDSATQRNRTDAQKLCSSRQIHPMIRFFAAGFVARDLMFASQGRDQFFCPAVSVTGNQSVSVKYSRDYVVRTRVSQYANGIDDFF